MCEGEREWPSSRARSEAAAAEQGAMLGRAVGALLVCRNAVAAEAVCRQVLTDLSQKNASHKILDELEIKMRLWRAWRASFSESRVGRGKSSKRSGCVVTGKMLLPDGS